MNTGVVNASEVIDSRSLGPFQWLILIGCGLVAALDGLDTQCIGYTAPMVAAAVRVPMHTIGLIISAGLVGATIGAFTFGPAADRFGRKWPLVLSCTLFSIFTFTTIFAHTLPQILVMRFLAGLGLGGAAPSFLALGGEYSPRRLRAIVVSSLYAAFPLGGVVGGLVGSQLITHVGWKSVFVLGGLGPAAMAVLVATTFPESLRFLLAKGERSARLGQILGRITGEDYAGVTFTSNVSQVEQGSGVVPLFTEGRALTTLVLWVPFFTAFQAVLCINTFAPTIFKIAHIPLATATLMLVAGNLGGVCGAIAVGSVMRKYGPFVMLVPFMIIGGISTALLGSLTYSLPLLTVDLFVEGVTLGGSVCALFALAAAIYPTRMRGSGIGWASGMGRVGQIVGPLVLGAMVAQHAGVPQIFFAMGAPSVVGGLAILGLLPARKQMDFGGAEPVAAH